MDNHQITQKNPVQSRRFSTLLTMGTLVLSIGILYWGRDVMMPIALAVLFSFILSPIVRYLQRKGLGPRISVALTVILAFLLIGGTGTLIIGEFRSLANELPAYQKNIRKRVADLHVALNTGSLGKVQKTVHEVVNELNKTDAPATTNTAPVPVTIKAEEGHFDPAVLKPLFGHLVTAGLVVVLVIFMLLRREDLRDRVLQLAGRRRSVMATKAIDEAGKQVSRYLLRQFLVNSIFGIIVGTGLWLLGLPYALLWGFIAGISRFVPYLGVVLGLAGPFLLGLAMLDGWTILLVIIAVYISLEFLAGMVIEPLIYGHGVGVSEVALLVMIAFWTWLWGGIGLLLATPLTVCLLVISKSVPDLKFIALFLNRKPALEVHQVFYQRLIAKDESEAKKIAARFLREHSQADLFEKLFISTLSACRRDCQQHRLADDDQKFIWQTIRRLIEQPGGEARDIHDTRTLPRGGKDAVEAQRPWVLGCPANDEADELGLHMLAKLLRDENLRMRVVSPGIRAPAELVEGEKNPPAMICIGRLDPGSPLPELELINGLGCDGFKVPVIVGRWGGDDQEGGQAESSNFAANIGRTLTDTKEQLIHHSQAGLFSKRSTNNDGTDSDGAAAGEDWIAPKKLKITFLEQAI